MVKDKTLLDFIYPIGSIYMSVSSTNPELLIGGEWVSWGAGRVPVGVDTTDSDFNSVEKTGGEKKHTMTIAEMPSHSHDSLNYTDGYANPTLGQGSFRQLLSGALAGTSYQAVKNSGSSQPFNIQQQYITCYMWKRTA